MRKSTAYYLLLLLAVLAGYFFFQYRRDQAIDEENFRCDPSLVTYSKHARCRMDCRHIDEGEVKEILEKGTINTGKSDLNGKPDPKYALEGITRDGQRVRIIFANTGLKLVVVTVIDLEHEYACDCE